MRGRKPVPTAILRLRGSKRAKSRGREPKGPPVHAEICPPAWFDSVAVEKFRELVELLGEMDLLTSADFDAVAAYCWQWSIAVRNFRKAAEDGEVVTHANGVTGRSHHLQVANDAPDRCLRIGETLGLSPLARTRLHVETPASKRVAFRDRKARFFG